MALWQEGDIVGPTNLNNKGASASSSAGFSTNTLSPESGATIYLGTNVLVSQVTQAREAFAWGGQAPSTTFCRLTTNLTNDQYGLSWNYRRSDNTQDDPSKPSWRMTGGYADGADDWFVSHAPAGTSLHSYLLYVHPTGFVHVGDSGITAPTGVETLQISGSTMRLSNSFTPASGTASGRTGDISWGTGFVYVCVSTNSWRRATLAAF